MRLKLAREFAARGEQPEFWLSDEKGELLGQANEFPVFCLNSPRLRSTFIPLVRMLLKRKPDGLLVAMWPLTIIALWASLFSRLLGSRTKLLVSDHNALSQKPETQGWFRQQCLRWSIRIFYPFAQARIGVSDGVVTDLVETSGLPKLSFDVVYNPAFSVLEQDYPDPWPDWKFRILSVGSMKTQKDQQLALRSFAMLDQIDSGLVILGDGALRPELEDLAEELGISGRVQMPGFAEDPSNWYAHASVFLLTSRWEGFGNVIVEALQHGLEVVSTDCDYGPSEILAGGRYGQLIPVGDINALTLAIQHARVRETKKTELKKRASEFSVQQIASKYLNLLFAEKQN